MKIELLVIGATSFSYLNEGQEIYEKRIKRYYPFQQTVLADVKGARTMDVATLREKEGEQFLSKLQAGDFVVLLDEKGKQYTSADFAKWLEKRFNQAPKRMVFIIAGAYGASTALKERADTLWSLSKGTFSHQMIRLFATEQIYRGISILHGLPYHNE